MGLILRAAAFMTGRRWAAWNALTSQPQEVQNRLLLQIIERNRSTRFGRDHRFDIIRSLSDYREQVEIGDYERLRPYIDAAKNGEANALTSEPVLMFTQTSGSTGQPKLIPITESARNNYRLLTRFWYYRAYVDHPECLSGKLLGIVSPATEGQTAGGVPYGAASGLIYESSPRWLQKSFVVPYEASQIKDSAAKYYIIMRLAARTRNLVFRYAQSQHDPETGRNCRSIQSGNHQRHSRRHNRRSVGTTRSDSPTTCVQIF